MTAQTHEILILNGIRTSMACEPPLPENDSRIIKYMEELQFYSTACFRRYVGTWEVKKGKLYLLKLTGKYKLVSKEPVLADWFSGTLRVPQGELLHYFHIGFASVYERELNIEINSGSVVRTISIDNRKKAKSIDTNSF